MKRFVQLTLLSVALSLVATAIAYFVKQRLDARQAADGTPEA